MKQRTRGVTLIGFIFFAICLCGVGYLALKIVPIYIDHYRVIHAAKSMNRLPKSKLKGPTLLVAALLKDRIIRQLHMNAIVSITKKDIKIKRKQKYYLVNMPYEVRKKLLANITILFEFNPEVEVYFGE